MQQTVESTTDMRRTIAERIAHWAPQKSVVLKAEYCVPAANAQTFTQVLERVASATTDAGGLSYFGWHLPVAQQQPGRVVFETYEEWATPDLFLNHWNSAELKQFQEEAERLLAGRPPSRLNLAEGPGRSSEAPAHRIEVLSTGQTSSWDANGQVRPVDSASGDDGDWEAGATYAGATRFRDNRDGTVTDTKTNLIWLKNANLFGEVMWEQALGNAAQLASGAPGLNDGSKPSDWRLPNVNEFQSVLDLDNTFGPALPLDTPFINLESSNYWTSSSVALAPALGWFTALAVGPPVFDLKFNLMRMWPVKGRTNRVARTGQKKCFDTFGREKPCRGTGQDGDRQEGAAWPARRFTRHDDGTVTDELTGLVWLQNADAFGLLSWQGALDVCNNLLDGQKGLTDDSEAGDWRLPNLNELRSLIDYSQFAPALPSGHPFRRVRSSLYWSSTTVASAPNLARFVFIGVGPSVWDHKSVMMNVWPVRDASARR